MNVRVTVKGTQCTLLYSGVQLLTAHGEWLTLKLRASSVVLERADYGLIELDNEGGIE